MDDKPPPLPPQPPEREGDTSNLISLSTFQSSSFDVHKFVTQLMNKDVEQSKLKPGPFNPQPHLETLEKTLSLLLPLRKTNALKISELERQVSQSERVYRSDVRGAKAGFETVNSQFMNLDSKITSVGRTAVRIGEQLESIDRLRQRAEEAHDLILYYNEFSESSNSSSHRLEEMKKEGGREGRHKVAIACRRLLSLSREVDQLGGVISSSSTTSPSSSSEGNSSSRTRESIERYCEKFEKDMLKLFDKYYRRGDPKAMAHCAKTLQDFNGGQSCIQIYVNQHDFFISKDRVQEIAATTSGTINGSIWESLPDPNCSPPKSEPGLSSLFDEIRVTVGQEAQIVSAVFPNPFLVMQVFLQRVFQQVIQGYIETLIETASSSLRYQSSTLAYLRILHLTRTETNSLVQDLKSHEFFKSLLLTTNSGGGGGGGGDGFSDHYSSSSSLIHNNHNSIGGVGVGPSLLNPLGGGSGIGGGGNPNSSSLTQVSQMLEQSLEELFVPYMEGSRYLEKESQSLVELFATKLIRFTNWHRSVNKTSNKGGVNTIFDRMVTQLSNAAHQAHLSSSNTTINDSTSTTTMTNSTTTTTSGTTNTNTIEDSSRLDRLMKFSGLSNIVEKASNSTSSPVLGSGPTEETNNSSTGTGGGVLQGSIKMFEEGDGDLNLETSEKMLEWHAEALGRMVELSPAGDVPKNAFTLLKVLADGFAKNYLETALDTAIHRLTIYDSTTSSSKLVEPNLSILSVLKPLDMIVQLWQRYISTALVPLAGTSVTVRREMSIFVNHVSVRIEGKVNQIVQRMTDGIVSYLNFSLSKQKKLDFKPKNDDLAFSRINTEPCLLVCDFLNKVRQVAKESLSGRNLQTFLTEVGVTFHTLLLDHFKKFSISATGGLMLTKDLALYQDTISSFSIPSLNDRFEMLRQLGNVFIVQPEILKHYLNESYLSRIENRLLKPFVMMRSDFGDYNKKFWDEILGGDTTTTAASTNTNTAVGDGTSSGGGGGFSRLGTLGTLSSLTSFSGLASYSSNPSSAQNTTTTGGGVGDGGGSLGGLGRKQSLFGNLMKDFEGLGLRDDTTTSSSSEFGSKRASMMSGH